MLDERVAPFGHLSDVPASSDVGIEVQIPPRGLNAALRALRPLLGDSAVRSAHTAVVLERMSQPGDPPKVADCVPIEDGSMSFGVTAHRASTGIRAFLDGIQRSRVIGHVNGSPIIFAAVGAVVRTRVDRQLSTWRTPRIKHIVLAARSQVGETAWTALDAAHVSPVDVETELPHPLAMRARAVELVAQERETLERRLAAEWCQAESEWLWIDGGISGNLAVDSEASAFGVIKSHGTLYGPVETIRAILGLTEGRRSNVFLVQHRSRRAVASWYLRVHTSASGDPLHGLVRIEVAPPDALLRDRAMELHEFDADAVRAVVERADTISAWILAERAPVALPDPRWDTLTYGVYACEQYLKALIGP